MKEVIKTVPIKVNEKKKKKFDNEITKAMNGLEEAVSLIKYSSSLIDSETNKTLNEDLIKKLEDMICELETCIDDVEIREPYLKKKGDDLYVVTP